MRIGIDITSAVRQGAGIGRFTRELIRALLTLDSPHEVALFAATGGLPRSITQPRLDHVTQPALDRHLKLEICDLKFVSDDWLHRIWHRARLPIPIQVMLGRVDVFHEPDFVLPPTLPGTPTILTVHDLTFIRDPDSALPQLRRYLNRVVPRSVAHATHVLADSLATKNDMVELFGTVPDHITVMYGGVDARFAPVRDPRQIAAVRDKYHLSDTPFILGLGTLQPRKNYKRLIQAFSNLKSQTPALPTGGLGLRAGASVSNLKLVIAGGKGWLYDEIFGEVERLGLEGHVLFPGFADDKDLPALYSAAELLAYPSLYEGFGLPVLEAMACGTPAITSNVSSLPEVGGDAALLVAPTDVDAIVQAMLRLLQDDAVRQTCITRGFERARQFTWENAAGQLLRLYTAFGKTSRPISRSDST